MDEYMNNIFGNDNDVSEEKKPENTASETKEETSAAAQEVQETEPSWHGGEYRYVPPKTEGTYQAPEYQPPYGTYYQEPDNSRYRPPVNEAPYQPPVFSQNMYSGEVPSAENPKKKRKAVVVIVIIAVICAVVAIAGIIAAGLGDNVSEKKENSTSQSEEQQESGEDASAKIISSDEAAKKDSDGNLTVAGVVENVKDSCVGITVYTEQNAYSYFYNYGQQSGGSDGETASGEGSGVIMSEANGKTYIMTCAHVISGGSSFTVTLDNDEEYEATIVGYDSQTDIGVLSINATGLTVAEFGDSKDIEVGEDCIAIGCPGGLTFKNSVTRGIVSALDVPISSSIGYNNECIQVDAAINPGNSGGALFNMQGQVIGINSSKIASTEYEGMGFAVPSNTAVEIANSLISDGYVTGRAKLGIQYTTLENYTSASSILQALSQKGFDNAQGTMVIQSVESESDLSGKVQQYDMIVAVNGETMTSVDILTSVLAKSSPGDTITLTIARIEGNQINTFDVDCKLIESKQ